uniref:PH domain-containing protein n=1 Tax=Pavo cristatus TaxID=9049 RepID=A0A8C9G679_PAVCR
MCRNANAANGVSLSCLKIKTSHFAQCDGVCLASICSFNTVHMFNTWKPMWVVLLEDGIEFYKRKSDNSPKGMIPLKGSTINSPCQDFA